MFCNALFGATVDLYDVVFRPNSIVSVSASAWIHVVCSRSDLVHEKHHLECVLINLDLNKVAFTHSNPPELLQPWPGASTKESHDKTHDIDHGLHSLTTSPLKK